MGPQREHVPGLAEDPDQRGQRGLSGPGERRPLFAGSVDRDPGGVGVDGQPVPCRGRAGSPGPAQHHPVDRGSLGHPTQIRGQEPPQRRHAGQPVRPAHCRGGRIGQQGPVAEEVTASKEDLGQRPVALTTGVATRADRAQAPPVGLGDHVEPVQQRPPQRDPGHRGQIRLRRPRHRGRHNPCGTHQQCIFDIEQRAGIVHHAGALLLG